MLIPGETKLYDYEYERALWYGWGDWRNETIVGGRMKTRLELAEDVCNAVGNIEGMDKIAPLYGVWSAWENAANTKPDPLVDVEEAQIAIRKAVFDGLIDEMGMVGDMVKAIINNLFDPSTRWAVRKLLEELDK